MSDATDRLLDAALRPLADFPEQRQTGLELLEKLRKPDHPGAAAMLARWEVVDARPRRRWWRRALALALVVLSVWVGGGAVRDGMRYRRVLWHFGCSGCYEAGAVEKSRTLICEGLSERDRFLLFGDLSQQSRSGQMRALWDSDPANPAAYAAYAFAYKRENQGSFPQDFLETAERVDPDNSWFTYHAAGALALNSVKKERQTSAARKAGDAPAWKVVNEEKLNQALAVLRKATMHKQFVNRQTELIAERVPLLPQPDLVSRVDSGFILLDYFGLDCNTQYLSDAIAAQAWKLGEAGDATGFKQLLGDAETFMRAFDGMKNPTLLDGLILRANGGRLIANLHSAAGKLGLAEEAAQLGRIKDRLEQWSEQRVRREESPESGASKMRCGLGNKGIISLRAMVKSPPPLPDADLQPGRMAEHLLASRACSLAVWVMLGLGLLAVVVYRFCLPPAVLRLAQRVNELLQPIDWAWLLVAGVLLPFGYVTALMRLTPLGGQDWGIHATGWTLPAADFLALALLLLVVPVWVARWRLSRRAAALGICSGNPLIGWLAVAAGLAFVPVLGLSAPMLIDECGLGRMDWNFENPSFIWKSVLLVPLLLLILASVVRALAVPFTRQFSRAVVALAVIPAYACGMLLVMLSLPVYQAAQVSWEHHDALTKLTANGGTRYEGEVARQLLQEVREVLELDGPP